MATGHLLATLGRSKDAGSVAVRAHLRDMDQPGEPPQPGPGPAVRSGRRADPGRLQSPKACAAGRRFHRSDRTSRRHERGHPQPPTLRATRRHVPQPLGSHLVVD